MIPGTIVSIGGEDFTVPPLALTQLRAFLPRIQQIAGLGPADMGDAQLEALVEIVTAALQRNYPDLTKERVEEILDLGNALPVLNAILGGIKLPEKLEPTRPVPGAGPAPGHFNPDHSAEDEPAASEGQPAVYRTQTVARPYDSAYPWRPNPPVVGS